jgi:hypothetical protein
MACRFTVDVGGTRWLASGQTELTVGHVVHSSADGGLVLVSATDIEGSDALGRYSGVVLKWSLGGNKTRHRSSSSINTSSTAHGHPQSTPASGVGTPNRDTGALTTRAPGGSDIVLETALFIGVDGTTLRLNTTLPLGAAGASVLAGHGAPATAAAWGTPSTAFPSFEIGVGGSKLGNGLGFVSYSEGGLGPTAGVFPTGYKAGEVAWDGVPLALVDRDSNTAAILSPSTKFYDTVFGVQGPADHPVRSASLPIVRVQVDHCNFLTHKARACNVTHNSCH